MTAKAISIEKGIATATNRLLRIPMKMNRTTTTRIKPLATLFSNSLIIMSTYSLSSITIVS